MERKERAWEERLRAAAGKREREREREAETTPPLLPILSLSVDLCAFHAETVEKGRERERERERETLWPWGKSFFARALAKAATAKLSEEDMVFSQMHRGPLHTTLKRSRN